MNRKRTLTLIMAVSLILISYQSFAQTAEELLPKAIQLEEVKGELEQAIEVYQTIVTSFPENKSIAAKAQFHIGLCYEKLGLEEAQKAYRAVVNNYPGQQSEVALAKERLSRLILIAEKELEIPLEPKFTKIKIPTKLSWSVKLSPDGKNLVLVSDKKLWKLPLSGNLGPGFSGTPVQLNTEGIKVDHQAGLSWSGDGKWIAFHEFPSADTTEKEKNNQSIFVVSSKGGKPTKVSETYSKGRIENFWISLSPDGKTLVHSSIKNNGQYVFSTPVDGGTSKQLVDIQSREPAYSSDGKWIAYVEDKNIGTGGGNLWIVPAIGGNPKLIAKAGYATSPVWSPDNSMIAFVDDDKKTKINVVEVPKEGKETGNIISIDAPEGTGEVDLLAGWTFDNKIGARIIKKVEDAIYSLPVQGGMATVVLNDCWAMQPRWSPDGNWIYYSTSENKGSQRAFQLTLASVPGNGGIGKLFTKDNEGKKVWHLGNQGGNRISPDGKTIVSAAWEELSTDINFPLVNIWKISTDGLESKKITNKEGHYIDFSPSWSPDGNKIAFIRAKLTRTTSDLIDTINITTINSEGGEEKILATISDKWIFSLVWSPDGKMLAYLSKEKEAPNTKHMNFINAENGTSMLRWKTSVGEANIESAWAPDSKRIAFNDREGKVIKIMNVKDGNIEDIKTNLGDVKIGHIDWSPDGEKFVFAGSKGREAEFWFVENFLPLEKLAQKKETIKESFIIRKVNDDTAAKFEAGSPSPDGKYFIFTDWDTGNLAIYESTTGKKRLLTKEGSWESDHVQYVENSTWSPDGKQIVYDWQNESGSIELHLVGIDGSNSRILYENEEWIWVQTFDWSADGKQILACFQRKGGIRQIVLVNAENGSIHVLKTLVGKNWMKNMSFSPDGRYIVYDYPPEEYSQDRDIYMISTDGGHEISLIKHPANDYVLGWAPDGENILFASDRTGTFDAFVIRVTDGKPQGVPKLIKPDIGNLSPWGFTQKGSFYYSTSKDGNNVYIADLDPETGKMLAPPKKAIKRFEGFNHLPYYSPNGKYLAYISLRNRQAIICIRNNETGKDREFSLSQFNIDRASDFRWSSDCSSIFAKGRDNKGRFGIIRINIQSGNITPVMPWESWKSTYIHSIELAKDEKAVFYVDFDNSNDWSVNNLSKIIKRDIETGSEKELYRFDTYINMSLSPDGKWLVSSHPKFLKVMPATGGEPRDLYRFKEEYNLERPVTWSADGKYILFSRKKSGQDGWELCRILAEGGEPQKTGLIMKKGFDNLSTHPNGRNIAFSAKGQKNTEFWVMENFLPEAEDK